jgi:hypothetical protein
MDETKPKKVELEGIFEEVQSGDVHNFEEEKQLTGVLIEKREAKGKYGNLRVYDLETGPNTYRTVFGSAILDDKLSKVDVGERIRITYEGKEKAKSGAEYKNFKVEREVFPVKDNGE